MRVLYFAATIAAVNAVTIQTEEQHDLHKIAGGVKGLVENEELKKCAKEFVLAQGGEEVSLNLEELQELFDELEDSDFAEQGDEFSLGGMFNKAKSFFGGVAAKIMKNPTGALKCMETAFHALKEFQKTAGLDQEDEFDYLF